MPASWDIKIGGIPYIFGDDPGILLGAALKEPGNPAEVGTAVVASLHGGIGRGFDNGIMQYDSASEADLTVPNTFLPGYPTVSVDSFTASNISIARPAFGFGNGADTVYVIAGQSLQYFDPTDPASGLTAVTLTGDTWPATSEFSGSSFQYNNQLVFGAINNDAGNEGKPAAYAVVTDLGTPGTVPLENSIGISYGASTRARAFWIEKNSDGYGLKWAPSTDASTFKGTTPYIEKPASGTPPIEIGLPRPSWLTMVGSALVIMRSDGAILGADTTGMLLVLGNTPVSGLEYNFGHRASPWWDGLLVPSRNGLWSFNLQSLTMRPGSPNYIQGQPIERLKGEVTAANGIGPYGFVALRQVSSASVVTSIAFAIVRYSDRIAVHDLIPETASGDVIVDFLPFYDTATRRTLLYYLVYTESTGAVAVRYKPLRLPSDQHTAATGISTAASVDLSSMTGPSPASNMTKLWTQVRGHFVKGSSGSAQLDFTGLKVDGKTVTLASVTADGPFAVEFAGTAANRIGRELTAGTMTLTNPVLDTRLDLPLTFDFVWVPSTTDAFSVKVLVSGNVVGRLASLWRRGPWDATKNLLALRSTTCTVNFPEGDTWTVFVEAVSISDLKDPDNESETARVATVQMRRLS